MIYLSIVMINVYIRQTQYAGVLQTTRDHFIKLEMSIGINKNKNYNNKIYYNF